MYCREMVFGENWSYVSIYVESNGFYKRICIWLRVILKNLYFREFVFLILYELDFLRLMYN